MKVRTHIAYGSPNKQDNAEAHGAPLGEVQRHAGQQGVAPLLEAAPGAVECKVTSIVEQGDHHIVVGEVVEAHQPKPFAGRPDAAILEMKDLGDNVFYGG